MLYDFLSSNLCQLIIGGTLNLPASYSISALACSISFAAFLGWLLSGIPVPFISTPLTSTSYNWSSWGFILGGAFLLYSFLPKWKWLYAFNALILLLASAIVLGIASSSSRTVMENFAWALVFAGFTLGAPFLLLATTWLWHCFASFALLTQTEPANAPPNP